MQALVLAVVLVEAGAADRAAAVDRAEVAGPEAAADRAELVGAVAEAADRFHRIRLPRRVSSNLRLRTSIRVRFCSLQFGFSFFIVNLPACYFEFGTGTVNAATKGTPFVIRFEAEAFCGLMAD
jgi:hypothetical protein